MKNRKEEKSADFLLCALFDSERFVFDRRARLESVYLLDSRRFIFWAYTQI